MVLGAVSSRDAWEQTRGLLPVVGFLALVLVLAQLCADDGLFEVAGAAVARWCGGISRRLPAGVFAVASAITAVLSLDATVVLLTLVVFAPPHDSRFFLTPLGPTACRVARTY